MRLSRAQLERKLSRLSHAVYGSYTFEIRAHILSLEQEIDRLKKIKVFISGGTVQAVQVDGNAVPAVVRDYDRGDLRDEDGNLYEEYVV